MRTLDQLPAPVRPDSEHALCQELLDLDNAALRGRCRQLKQEHLAPVDPTPRANSTGYRVDDDGSITGRFYFTPESAMILRAGPGWAGPNPDPPPTGSRTPAAPRSAPATP
ncbi:MAG: hypothetical protein ACR2F6_04475 [Mycobacteriales bacterium]